MVVIAIKMIRTTHHVMVGFVPSGMLEIQIALRVVKKMHAQIKNVRHVIRVMSLVTSEFVNSTMRPVGVPLANFALTEFVFR